MAGKMRIRYLAAVTAALSVAACDGGRGPGLPASPGSWLADRPVAVAGAPGKSSVPAAPADHSASGPLAAGGGTPGDPRLAVLTIAVRWPEKRVQAIPMSARKMRVRVLKGAAVLAEESLNRPDARQTDVQFARLLLEADSGLTIRVEAFEQTTLTESSRPIAAAEKTGYTLLPNRVNTLSLSLVPAFTLRILDVSPRNGGPGVPVAVTGLFDDWRDLSVFLGPAIGEIDATSSQEIRTRVPAGAASGEWRVWANGIYSPATASFRVLGSLDLRPSQATVSVGDTIAFAVPEGTDTAGATLSAPTLTAWSVVEPVTGATTSVGTISAEGAFLAKQAGTAEIRVFSGTVQASALVEVQ